MSQYLKVSEIELILRLQLELRNQAVVSLALMNHHLNKGQFQIMHMDMCGATMWPSWLLCDFEDSGFQPSSSFRNGKYIIPRRPKSLPQYGWWKESCSKGGWQVVYPIVYKVFSTIPSGWSWDSWTINSITPSTSFLVQSGFWAPKPPSFSSSRDSTTSSCGPATHKVKKARPETWTMKYWLFNRDPYIMVNPHITVV